MEHQRSTSKRNRVFYPLIIIGLSCLVFGLSMIIFQERASAVQINLAWDESDGAAGYKIYSGTESNNYTWVVDVGKTISYTTANLTDGYTYYFAATAYDASGLESDYSDEVSYSANTVPCSYSISPASAAFNTSGGSGSIVVTTQSGCNWSASSGVSWVTITSGSSGTGSGTIAYTVASNSSAARSVVSTIAGQLFTFNQSGTQSYTINASAGTGGTITPLGATVRQLLGPADLYDCCRQRLQRGQRYRRWRIGRRSHFLYLFKCDVKPYHRGNVHTGYFLPALTVTQSGTGTGTVTTSPAGTSFATGTVVTLTATTNANSTLCGMDRRMFRNGYHLSGNDERKYGCRRSLRSQVIYHQRFGRCRWYYHSFRRYFRQLRS